MLTGSSLEGKPIGNHLCRATIAGGKTRCFEQKPGHEPITIAKYGKVLLRSGESITLDMVQPLIA